MFRVYDLQLVLVHKPQFYKWQVRHMQALEQCFSIPVVYLLHHTWFKWSARHQALQWPDKEPFIWIRCGGRGKHRKHAVQWVIRTGIEKHWITSSCCYCCCLVCSCICGTVWQVNSELLESKICSCSHGSLKHIILYFKYPCSILIRAPSAYNLFAIVSILTAERNY